MKKIEILYEDKDIIVCVKPAGVSSQAERSFSEDMVSILMNHLASNNVSNPYIGVIHRLDKPVSGVMVYAKNKKAAANLSAQLQNHTISKHYKALVCGDINKISEKYINTTPNESSKAYKLSHLHMQDKKNNLAVICDSNTKKENYRSAVLFFDILSTYPVPANLLTSVDSSSTLDNPSTLSEVDIELVTGRFHQIRAQFAHIGFPLLGDHRYNPIKYRNISVALCAYKLSFKHPVSGELKLFEICQPLL